VISGSCRKCRAGFLLKIQKTSFIAGRKSAADSKSGTKNFRPQGIEFMKNARLETEIKPEDFDSFFLWKVFRKIVRHEGPLRFFLKVLAVGACFVALALFIFLLGELAVA
jgi:hypothetical protein